MPRAKHYGTLWSSPVHLYSGSVWLHGDRDLTVGFPGPPLLRRALNPGISPRWGSFYYLPLLWNSRVVSSRSYLDSLWPGFLLYTKRIPGPSCTNLVLLARRSLERRQSAGVTIYKHCLQTIFTNNIYKHHLQTQQRGGSWRKYNCICKIKRNKISLF